MILMFKFFSSADIGKAIGRSRQTVDNYIANLRAASSMGRDIKIFRMNRLGIPQDRMAKRLGMDQKTIQYHVGKMPILANSLNGDLSRGFTVAQMAADLLNGDENVVGTMTSGGTESCLLPVIAYR